jgi:hypothetical protein
LHGATIVYCVYMHTCIHTYIHTHIHTYLRWYIHTYIHHCMLSRIKIGALWPLIAILGCIPHNSGCSRAPPLYNNRRYRLAESFPSMYGSRGRRHESIGRSASLQFCQFSAKTGKLTTRPPYLRLTIVGPAEMTTSGAPFVIALSGVVHELVGARSDHKVHHSQLLTYGWW